MDNVWEIKVSVQFQQELALSWHLRWLKLIHIFIQRTLIAKLITSATQQGEQQYGNHHHCTGGVH